MPPAFLANQKKKAAEGSAAEEKTESPAQERAEDGPVKKVRDMVSAHSKVPDAKKPAYKALCIKHARKAGAMKHIPSSWLKKGD
jgi:uncharacterized membrane protein